MKTYAFRNEATDAIEEIPFEEMMNMDSMGVIERPDGTVLRRVRINERLSKKCSEARKTGDVPVVSDSIGFGAHELQQYQEDAKGYGVDFKPDPREPGYYQVHASNRAEFQRYMKHRGVVDKTSGYGSFNPLPPGHLEKAREMALRGVE